MPCHYRYLIPQGPINVITRFPVLPGCTVGGPRINLTLDKLDKVISLLVDIRRDARTRKDFATSDAIRNKLSEAGVLLKDEKDGTVSYTLE